MSRVLSEYPAALKFQILYSGIDEKTHHRLDSMNQVVHQMPDETFFPAIRNRLPASRRINDKSDSGYKLRQYFHRYIV
jgi:hypothetical protein